MGKGEELMASEEVMVAATEATLEAGATAANRPYAAHCRALRAADAAAGRPWSARLRLCVTLVVAALDIARLEYLRARRLNPTLPLLPVFDGSGGIPGRLWRLADDGVRAAFNEADATFRAWDQRACA